MVAFPRRREGSVSMALSLIALQGPLLVDQAPKDPLAKAGHSLFLRLVSAQAWLWCEKEWLATACISKKSGQQELGCVQLVIPNRGGIVGKS